VKPFGFLLLLASPLVLAADLPATDESIRKLLEVTEGRKLIDGMYPQLDAIMESGMKQALGKATLSPGQREILDAMSEKIVVIVKEEMDWQLMEPRFIDIYRKSFTEEEVQGMLAFYRAPAGQAVIRKMPVVMQGAMGMVQEQMQRMGPRMQAVQQEALRQLKTCCKEED
jgi:uncharacterized protein